MRKVMAHPLAIGLAASAAISSAFASVMLYMLIENNNQYEAYDPYTGKYDLPYLSKLFAIAFSEAFLALSVVPLIIYFLYRTFGRAKGSSPDRPV